MVVLAAMPRARVPTVAAVNSGLRRSRLAAPRRSWIQTLIAGLLAPRAESDVLEAHLLELALHLRRAGLLDDAAVEEVQRAGVVAGPARVVRHHADGGALAM